MKKISKLMIVSITVAALIIVSFFVISTVQFSTGKVSTTVTSSNNASAAGNSSNTVYFTIIESDRGPMEGMNGSAYHLNEGEAWPVMVVQLGDIVIIHIESVNSSEPHGFTIVNYFYPGVSLLPGGSYTLRFVANKQGTFLVTCLIFCVIHPLMDYGKLVVQ